MEYNILPGTSTTRDLRKVVDALIDCCKQGGTTMIVIVANDALDKVQEIRTMEMDSERVKTLLRNAIELIDNPDITAFADEHGVEHVLDETGVKN